MSDENVKVEGGVVDTGNPPQEEMVEVKLSILEKLLERQQQTDREMKVLRQAANQNKLIQAENSNKPKEMPRAFLKVFMGKIVDGWKTERAEYIYTTTGATQAPVGEILKATYHFTDKTESGIVDQVLFTREDNRAWFRIAEDKGKTVVLSFEGLETNDESMREKFVAPDGDIEIRKDFLNP